MRLHAYLLFDRSLLYHSEFSLKIRERENRRSSKGNHDFSRCITTRIPKPRELLFRSYWVRNLQPHSSNASITATILGWAIKYKYGRFSTGTLQK